MSYYGMPFGLDPRFTFFVCLGVGFGLILLAIALKIRLRGYLRASRRPEAPIDRDKLVVLLGQGEKIIESGIAGVFISLEKFFRDIGFSVIIAPDPHRFDR